LGRKPLASPVIFLFPAMLPPLFYSFIPAQPQRVKPNSSPLSPARVSPRWPAGGLAHVSSMPTRTPPRVIPALTNLQSAEPSLATGPRRPPLLSIGSWLPWTPSFQRLEFMRIKERSLSPMDCTESNPNQIIL
jgi:hypothetical protein